MVSDGNCVIGILGNFDLSLRFENIGRGVRELEVFLS